MPRPENRALRAVAIVERNIKRGSVGPYIKSRVIVNHFETVKIIVPARRGRHLHTITHLPGIGMLRVLHKEVKFSLGNR